MDVNRNNAKAYKKELADIKRLLEGWADDNTSQKVSEAFDSQQKAMALDQTSSLPSNVNNWLANNTDNRRSVREVGEKIKLSKFPHLRIDNLSQDEKTIILELFNANSNKEKRQELEKEYMPLLIELEGALDYIEKNDKNMILSLFQSRNVKNSLEERKAFVSKEYPKLSYIKSQLARSSGLSQVSNEVRNDFYNNTNSYTDNILEITGYNPNMEDGLLNLFKDEAGKIISHMEVFDREALSNKINGNWDRAREERIPEELQTMPLEMLDAGADESLPMDKLIHILSVGDLDKYDKEGLKRATSLTDEEADLVVSQTDKFVENYKDQYYLRLDSDNLSPTEYELLRSIKNYQNIDSSKQDLFYQAKSTIEEVNSSISFIETRAKNDYKAVFLTDSEYGELEAKKDDLAKSFSLLINQYSNFPKLRAYSDEELRRDFKQNSADYYAVIDKVTGSTEEYRPGDLPSFIVEKVNEFDLYTDDLKGTLRPYQDFGAKYSLQYKRTLLGDEMGLGKTVQAIGVLSHLYHEGKTHSIVIAPLTLLANWDREIQKWVGYDTNIFRGNKRQAAFDGWMEKGGVLLTNYEQTRHLLNMLGEETFDLIIVDEAHKIKNPEAKRSINTYALSDKAEYVLYMTGTALENRLDEMKQLISVLQPNLIDKIEREAKDDNPDIFKRLVSLVYLRRKRIDVLQELPEIEIVEMWSNFSKNQKPYYKKAVADGPSGMMRMRRAAFYEEEELESEKIDHIIDICEEAKDDGDKVLIFSFFKIVLNYFRKYIEKDVIGMISGDVPVSDRQAMVDKLGESGPGSVLLAQIDAGGTGLNIQAANIVILCEPQYKPSTENQAISRVYRMGQNKTVIVYRLLTENSVDETLLDLLGTKQNIFDTYAKDSAVADAYISSNAEAEEMTETELTMKLLDIERERIKAEEDLESDSEASFEEIEAGKDSQGMETSEETEEVQRQKDEEDIK